MLRHSYDFYRIKQILKGFKNAQTWKLFLDEYEKYCIVLDSSECEVAFSVALYTTSQICISYSNFLLNKKEKHNIRYLPLSSMQDEVNAVYNILIKIPSSKVPEIIKPESCKLFLGDFFVGNLKQQVKYANVYIVSILEFANINKKIFF
jgi:hypothetical protein